MKHDIKKRTKSKHSNSTQKTKCWNACHFIKAINIITVLTTFIHLFLYLFLRHIYIYYIYYYFITNWSKTKSKMYLEQNQVNLSFTYITFIKYIKKIVKLEKKNRTPYPATPSSDSVRRAVWPWASRGTPASTSARTPASRSAPRPTPGLRTRTRGARARARRTARSRRRRIWDI